MTQGQFYRNERAAYMKAKCKKSQRKQDRSELLGNAIIFIILIIILLFSIIALTEAP